MNYLPFLVHVELGNIDNLHPMSLGKTLPDQFSSITNIKRLDKNLIVINFKFSFNTNQFVQSSNLLPNNWLTYIPNYKIFRSNIVKGVDLSVNKENIPGNKMDGQAARN